MGIFGVVVWESGLNDIRNGGDIKSVWMVWFKIKSGTVKNLVESFRLEPLESIWVVQIELCRPPQLTGWSHNRHRIDLYIDRVLRKTCLDGLWISISKPNFLFRSVHFSLVKFTLQLCRFIIFKLYLGLFLWVWNESYSYKSMFQKCIVSVVIFLANITNCWLGKAGRCPSVDWLSQLPAPMAVSFLPVSTIEPRLPSLCTDHNNY